MTDIFITALKMFVAMAIILVVSFFALAVVYQRKNAGELFMEDAWAWALYPLVGSITYAVVKHRQKR